MKNFRVLSWCLMLVSALFMTSCFDILEEYEFNADGSGKARMTIDMTEMMAMMASFSAMDSTGETQKSLDEMFTDNSTVETLKQVAGISNVSSLSDRESSIVGYSYEFESIEALNNALAATSESSALADLGLANESGEGDGGANYFAQKGKKFSRVVKFAPKEDAEGEEGAEYDEMAKSMFGDAKYDVRYTFAQGVKTVKKNKYASVGPNGRTVTVSIPMMEMMDQKASPACDIVLKSK